MNARSASRYINIIHQIGVKEEQKPLHRIAELSGRIAIVNRASEDQHICIPGLVQNRPDTVLYSAEAIRLTVLDLACKTAATSGNKA